MIDRYATEQLGDFFYGYPADHADAVAILSVLMESLLGVIVEDFGITWSSEDITPPIFVVVLPGTGWHPSLRVYRNNPSEPVRADFFVRLNEIHPEIRKDLPQKLGSDFIYLHQRICTGMEADYYDGPTSAIHMAFREASEAIFTIDPDYDHPVLFFDSRAIMPLRGILAGAADPDAWGHGTGLIPLAKYLLDDPRFGPVGFKNTYEQVRSGTSAMDALVANVTVPIRTWLPEFFIEYLSGKIYGVDYNLLIADPVDNWTPGPDDEPFYLNDGLSLEFPDLSAKVIPIQLESAYSDNAKIHVKATGEGVNDEDLSVILFAKRGEVLRYLGHGQNWFLENIQMDLVGLGVRQLFAVVVNSSHSTDYMSGSELDVEMSLSQSAGFRYVTLSTLTIDADIHWDPDGPTRSFEDYDLPEVWAEGQITPPTFSVPVNFRDDRGGGDYRQFSGTISGEINEDASTLYNLDVNVTWLDYLQNQESGSGSMRVVASGPLDAPLRPGWIAAYGEDICNYVTVVERRIVAPHGGSNHISDWSCAEGNYFSLNFSESR